ncbi:MAG: hypothetical protein HC793_00155 [Aquincola sp.]|nr:hypothetical protein [Aquincola sp.]
MADQPLQFLNPRIRRLLCAALREYQRQLVDRFPPPRANTHNYIPDITGGTPRSDKIAYVLGRAEKKLRFPLGEFQRWLEHRNLPVYATVKRMEDELGMKMLRCKLGLGTKWELPVQRCYEVSVATIASRMDAIAGAITGGDSSRPDDTPGSPPETVPED